MAGKRKAGSKKEKEVKSEVKESEETEEPIRRSARLAKKAPTQAKQTPKRKRLNVHYPKRIGESSVQYEATEEDEENAAKAKQKRYKKLKLTKEDVYAPPQVFVTAVAERTKEKVSKEIQDRKKKSIAILKKAKIPTLASLPYIGRGTLRDIKQVKDRLVILFHVQLLGALVSMDPNAAQGVAQGMAQELKKKHKIWDAVTDEERAFFEDPTTDDRFNYLAAQFRIEGVWVLLWALNLIDEDIGYPKEMCRPTKQLDFPLQFLTIPYTMPKFQQAARKLTGNKNAGTLRTLAEIEDKLDLTYRTHWAYVDRVIVGAHSEDDVNRRFIAEEWHQVLGWLTSDVEYDAVDISKLR